MKRKTKINKWVLAFRILATLVFVGTASYSLSFRMSGNDSMADLVLHWLFGVYGGYFLVSSYIIITRG